MSRVYIYTYRPKYRETKEEFDRGYRGRRLKKIQNEKRERRERKKERETVEIKKLSSLYRRMAGSLILWIVRVKRPFRNLHGNCQPALGFHKRFKNVGT